MSAFRAQPDLKRGCAFAAEPVLVNRDVGKLLDASDPASQRQDIEGVAAGQRRVVAFKGCQQGRFDVAAVAAFENAEIPGIVAIDAAIDQPHVDTLAIGVDAEFVAAAIGLHRAAAVAVDQGSRCGAGRDRPANSEMLRQAENLPMRKFFRPAMSRCPCGHGVARASYGRKSGATGDSHATAVQQCQTGLEPPPEEHMEIKQAPLDAAPCQV